MKRLYIAILFTVAQVLTAQAQLLWRVTGNGIAEPCYLVGTHHIAPATFIDSIPGLSDALARSKQVFVELEADSMRSHEAQLRIAAMCFAPADSTLDRLLTPDELTLVQRVVTDYMGDLLTLEMLKMLKPVAITTELQTTEAQKYFPEAAQAQIDEGIQLRARRLGIPVKSLETLDMQLATLFDTPLDVQAQDLVEVCRNDSLFIDYNRRLALLYRQQDLGSIWILMNDDELGTDQDELERLIYSRNRRWTEQLQYEFAEQPTLVAVGAGHLPGEQGLIALLRKRGFTVEPYYKQLCGTSQ